MPHCASRTQASKLVHATLFGAEQARSVSSPVGRIQRFAYRRAHDALPFPFLASMALTVFAKAFSRTPLPMVPTTNPSSRPLRFLPSRTTTASTSVVPLGRRVRVYVWPEAPPHRLESVVVSTMWLGSDQSYCRRSQIPFEPSVTSAWEGPRLCTLRYPSALLLKSCERSGPKSVSAATNC